MTPGSARRRVFLLFVLALISGTETAWGQYSNQPGHVAGTIGGVCDSSAINYGWPDTNGNVLKCVSNVWTLVAQPATAAGSDKQIQFNASNSFSADSNFNWDYTNHRLGIGTSTPTYDLSFGGAAGREIGLERVASGAGNNLTISAGGAASGATAGLFNALD